MKKIKTANDRFQFYGDKERVFDLACHLLLVLDEADQDDYLKNGDQSFPAYGHYEYSESADSKKAVLILWESQKRIHFDWLMEMFDDVEGMFYIEDGPTDAGRSLFRCHYTKAGNQSVYTGTIECEKEKIDEKFSEWIRINHGEAGINGFKKGRILKKG